MSKSRLKIATRLGILFISILISDAVHATTTVDLPTSGIKIAADSADNRLISGRVKNIGDFNNDGFDDFMLAVYYNSEGGSYAGKVYLFYGSTTRKTAMNITDADATFTGSEGRIAGSDLSGNGDINKDGCSDVLIGGEGIYLTSSAIDGRVYLLYGRGTGCAATTAYSGNYSLDSSSDAIFTGKARGDYAGTGVAVSPDVNGDGYDDIVIGAYGNDDSYSNAGITYVIYGKSAQFSGTIGLNRVDTRVAASSSKFTIYLPKISGVLIKGAAANDYSGVTVSGAGDINKDGYGDILIAKTGGGSGPSKVYLIYGSASLTSMDLSKADKSYESENATDEAIDLPDNHGDLNNDGYDDIVIGAAENNSGGTAAGRVYVFYGAANKITITPFEVMMTTLKNRNLSSASVIFTGESSYSNAGDCLSFAGDVNADGYDDLLIGAPMDQSESAPGRSYLIYGSGSLASIGLASADVKFTDDAWYHDGRSISGGGDYDGDGVPDPLIVVSGSDHSTSSSYGAAYIVYDF